MDWLELSFLNLAIFKYNKLLSSADTPIEKINVINFQNNFNENFFEVQSWLKNQYKCDKIESSKIYGTCDSTGSDKFLHIATWKCFSEAIERWAFNSLIHENFQKYGLNIDKTTTGFAALPAFPSSAVRKFAYSEAIERWAISNWWLGNISSKQVTPNSLIIIIPDGGGYTVITYGELVNSRIYKHYYGFAHSFNFKKALLKAEVEMNRNKRALENLNCCEPASMSDKRLLFFATDEGFDLFCTNSRKSNLASPRLPKLITDEKIPGDWEKYSTVWRCLLPGTEYNWESTTHFMF